MRDRQLQGDDGDGTVAVEKRRVPIAIYAVLAVVGIALLGLGLALALPDIGSPEIPESGITASSMLEPLPEVAPATDTVTTEPVGTPVPSAREPTPVPIIPLVFNVDNAMDMIRGLESFGARKGGSPAETSAAQWLQQQLRAMGYDARLQDVPLPNGTMSHNVIARSTGTSLRVIVLGAHLDTKPPSPGANDNASGCGALLEIARVLAEQPVPATVELVFYGAEEIIDSNAEHHHFGSRAHVAAMSGADRSNTAGMISVDMIGYGPDFHSRTMRRGPQHMSDLVLAQARTSGVKMTYLRDPGASGWSDHEAYELAGIPATWIEWRDDPVYHTLNDTSGHLDPRKIRTAGQLVLDVISGLDAAELESLIARQ